MNVQKIVDVGCCDCWNLKLNLNLNLKLNLDFNLNLNLDLNLDLNLNLILNLNLNLNGKWPSYFTLAPKSDSNSESICTAWETCSKYLRSRTELQLSQSSQSCQSCSAAYRSYSILVKVPVLKASQWTPLDLCHISKSPLISIAHMIHAKIVMTCILRLFIYIEVMNIGTQLLQSANIDSKFWVTSEVVWSIFNHLIDAC